MLDEPFQGEGFPQEADSILEAVGTAGWLCPTEQGAARYKAITAQAYVYVAIRLERLGHCWPNVALRMHLSWAWLTWALLTLGATHEHVLDDPNE